MDLDFIKRAEQVTSFNLKTTDFTTLKYKAEIQHLFNKHFFPSFNLASTINSVDQSALNRLISELKSKYSENFSSLHNYNLKGVGPGEATLYFLVNTATLGGGSSAGMDINVGTKGYEVKAAKVTNDGYAIDFKLGGTVPLSEIITKLVALSTQLKLSVSRTEISTTLIQRMMREAPKEFDDIEKLYAKIAYEEYFKNHEVIFINNSKSSKVGNIEAVKQVALSDIKIERVTSGTVKPKIKLK